MMPAITFAKMGIKVAPQLDLPTMLKFKDEAR